MQSSVGADLRVCPGLIRRAFRGRGRHAGLPLRFGCAIYSMTINPRAGRGILPTSRERRLNSIVADATGNKIRAHRGLKPTAKLKAPLTRRRGLSSYD